ncbi:unnamed protein product, partial [Trichogramma brassicae]
MAKRRPTGKLNTFELVARYGTPTSSCLDVRILLLTARHSDLDTWEVPCFWSGLSGFAMRKGSTLHPSSIELKSAPARSHGIAAVNGFSLAAFCSCPCFTHRLFWPTYTSLTFDLDAYMKFETYVDSLTDQIAHFGGSAKVDLIPLGTGNRFNSEMTYLVRHDCDVPPSPIVQLFDEGFNKRDHAAGCSWDRWQKAMSKTRTRSRTHANEKPFLECDDEDRYDEPIISNLCPLMQIDNNH